MAIQKICLDPACVRFVLRDDGKTDMEINQSCPIDQQAEAKKFVSAMATGSELRIIWKDKFEEEIEEKQEGKKQKAEKK